MSKHRYFLPIPILNSLTIFNDLETLLFAWDILGGKDFGSKRHSSRWKIQFL